MAATAGGAGAERKAGDAAAAKAAGGGGGEEEADGAEAEEEGSGGGGDGGERGEDDEGEANAAVAAERRVKSNKRGSPTRNDTCSVGNSVNSPEGTGPFFPAWPPIIRPSGRPAPATSVVFSCRCWLRAASIWSASRLRKSPSRRILSASLMAPPAAAAAAAADDVASARSARATGFKSKSSSSSSLAALPPLAVLTAMPLKRCAAAGDPVLVAGPAERLSKLVLLPSPPAPAKYELFRGGDEMDAPSGGEAIVRTREVVERGSTGERDATGSTGGAAPGAGAGEAGSARGESGWGYADGAEAGAGAGGGCRRRDGRPVGGDMARRRGGDPRDARWRAVPLECRGDAPGTAEGAEAGERDAGRESAGGRSTVAERRCGVGGEEAGAAGAAGRGGGRAEEPAEVVVEGGRRGEAPSSDCSL